MGICSKAKEIIYSSKLCDVNIRPPENEKDNLIINSIPNTNNNTFNIDNNVINVVNINNHIINKKSNGNDKDNKLENGNSTENKSKINVDSHFHEKLSKLKKKKNGNKKNSQKLIVKSSKDVIVKFDLDNENSQINEKNENININSGILNANSEVTKERKASEDKNEKFKRKNQKKFGTHIHHRLPEKLIRIEMNIPVFQESLITQNFGSPDKYYKKLRNLGSGSYGTVYLAKNILKENLVAIKVIEKIPSNIIDDMEIKILIVYLLVHMLRLHKYLRQKIIFYIKMIINQFRIRKKFW